MTNAYQVYTGARQLLEGYAAAMQPLCRREGLAPNGVDILLFLANNPGLETALDLCTSRGQKPGSVSVQVEKLVQDNVRVMNIKTPSSKTLIKSLSGGNQQKVLIGRWLANDPDVLILDEPTRGIDVGAKYEIYCIIADLAKQGKSIIMISSEMGELIGMSDRIMVMCDGRVTGFVQGEEATQENIMALATQFE